MGINKNPNNIYQFLTQSFENSHEMNLLGWITNNQIHTISNEQYRNKIETYALILSSLQIAKGCRVVLIGENSPEWHLWDLAIMSTGAISVPVLPTLCENDLQIIINEVEPHLVLVDSVFQLRKIRHIDKKNPQVFFFIEPEDKNSLDPNNLKFISDFNQDDLKSFNDIIYNSISLSDIATIVYTSGTTGNPRGAVITHGALLQMLHNLKSTLKSHISASDRILTFLPLSHILGRCNSLLGLLFGIQNIYSLDQEHLLRDFELAKPTIFIGVPRIFEKIQLSILKKMEKKSSIQRAYFHWANECSNLYFSKIDSDRAPSTSEIIQRNIAYKSVFKPIYEKFGGRVRFFVSGGAPLASNVSRFLRNCNLLILEGYGLTETIGPCFLSPIQKPTIGSVGLPIGDVKLKLEKDGEILIQSQALFSFYFGQEERSIDSGFTEDGWYKTGDVGTLNSEGQLVIIDRKKDLIVTSNGKNIAPQKIEKILRKSSLIQEAIVIGDKRPFLTCLLLLNKENCISMVGTDRHIDLRQLTQSPLVVEAVQSHINACNQNLSKHEQIIHFHLLTDDITDNPYLMSASLKVRRQHVLNSFEKEINAMYKNDPPLT